jgi:hypothetical protein
MKSMPLSLDLAYRLKSPPMRTLSGCSNRIDGETTIARLDTRQFTGDDCDWGSTTVLSPGVRRGWHLGSGPTGDGFSFIYSLHPTTGNVLAAIELLPATDGYPVALTVSSDTVLVWLSNGILLQVDPSLHEITSA